MTETLTQNSVELATVDLEGRAVLEKSLLLRTILLKYPSTECRTTKEKFNCEPGILNLARNHALATKVGKPNRTSALICPCCLNTVYNIPISIFCCLTETYFLGLAYHIYFHFIKASIVVLSLLITLALSLNFIKNGDWIVLLVNSVLIWTMNTYFDAYKIRSQQKFSSVANLTVFVKDLHPEYTSQSVIERFLDNISNSHEDVKVVNISLVYDMEDIMELDEKIIELQSKITTINIRINKTPTKEPNLQVAKELSELEKNLQTLIEARSNLIWHHHKLQNPRHALITFDSRKGLEKFVSLYRSSSSLPFSSDPKAPGLGNSVLEIGEPQEINWKGLGHSKKSDLLYIIQSYFIMVVGGSSTCLIIIWATVLNNYNIPLTSLFAFFLNFYFSDRLVKLSKMQNAYSDSERINRSSKRMTIFALFNKCAIFSYFFVRMCMLNYDDIGMINEFELIVEQAIHVLYYYFSYNLLLPSLLSHVDAKLLMKCYKQFKYSRNPETIDIPQIELNHIFEYPEFNFEQRLGWVCKVFLLVLFLSYFKVYLSAMGILSLVIIYWFDKTVLVKYSKRSPKLGNGCLETVKFALNTSNFMIIIGYFFYKMYSQLGDFLTNPHAKREYFLTIEYFFISYMVVYVLFKLVEKQVRDLILKIMERRGFLNVFNADLVVNEYSAFNPANTLNERITTLHL